MSAFCAPLYTHEELRERMSLSGGFPSGVFESSHNGSVFELEHDVVGRFRTNKSRSVHRTRNFENRFSRNEIQHETCEEAGMVLLSQNYQLEIN